MVTIRLKVPSVPSVDDEGNARPNSQEPKYHGVDGVWCMKMVGEPAAGFFVADFTFPDQAAADAVLAFDDVEEA